MRKTKILLKNLSMALVLSLVLSGCQVPGEPADVVPSSVVVSQESLAVEEVSSEVEESDEVPEE